MKEKGSHFADTRELETLSSLCREIIEADSHSSFLYEPFQFRVDHLFRYGIFGIDRFDSQQCSLL